MIHTLRWITLSTLSLICLHCGGGQLSHHRYTDDEASYRIGQLSSEWRPIDVDGQNDLAWHHDRQGAVLQVNASCARSLDIPLSSLTNHLLIGFTERSIHRQERVPLAQREALFTELQAKLDGQPRHLALVVLKKDGCVYDFSLIAINKQSYDMLIAQFKTFLSGFST
jgi:PAS domain-containing protein